MGKWTRNIRQMEYKKIKWPVEVIARTKIDGQWKYKLRATWYDAPEVVTDCEDSLDLPFEVRDETVKTIEELHEMSSDARIRKRGGVVYKCPLCGKTFAPGRKDCAESHLNGRHKGEKRKASCPVRKKDPNDDCNGPTGLDVVPVNK
uniref:Uncharacterized protein n=2 Tax=Tetranychus urticae TaxID=32264 RepID=T1KG03_TETUR